MDYSRRSSRIVDQATGLRSDQTIVLHGTNTLILYPEPLRRATFYDAESDRRFAFLTNNITLSTRTIAQLYRCRWQVDLLFKWIKQNLRIKAFYGHTENAVKTQIWIATSIDVLVAIMKKELQIDRSQSDILQILSATLFEKTKGFKPLFAPPRLSAIPFSQPVDTVRLIAGQLWVPPH